MTATSPAPLYGPPIGPPAASSPPPIPSPDRRRHYHNKPATTPTAPISPSRTPEWISPAPRSSSRSASPSPPATAPPAAGSSKSPRAPSEPTPNTGPLIFSDRHFYLHSDNDDGTGSKANSSTGQYTTFPNLGEYVTIAATFDPAPKNYLTESLSGTKTSADLASIVAERSLPWLSATSGNPGAILTFLIGSNDVITVDIDSVKISNITSPIPEPSTEALLAGFGVFGLAASRRRERCSGDS